ncbi:MAG: DUF1684 domain-containing protein, partial [Caldithrix sp.]|nr:DUF1684 domain-containing protein [Caldithrix sp.]
MLRIVTLTLMLAGLMACRQNDGQTASAGNTADSLQNAFRAYIQEKDQQFRQADWSPLKDNHKDGFEGLRYYPYQQDWRYVLPIERYQTPDSMIIRGTREGDQRPALRYGYIEFSKKGESHRLQIIKILPRKPGGQSHLFLGFRDRTSGQETYGGGRYIDVKPTADGRYVVDFNYAYNPYCAYSDRYSCAIPPEANDLD